MGGDAQIVLGNLSTPDASRLLRISFTPTKSNEEKLDIKNLLKIVNSYDQKMAKDLQQHMQDEDKKSDLNELNKKTKSIANTLLSLLKSENIPVLSQQSSDALVQTIANDYAWVRWRKSTGKDWINLHPAFADQPSPKTKAKRFISGKVPKEFLHQIALQLYIERQTGKGELEQVAIMDRFERPTSELFKNQISLGLVPLDPDPNNTTNPFIVPILNNVVAPGGQAVTALGLTANVEDIASGSAKLFATLSSKMGGALGALNEATDGNADSSPRLTGIIINIEIISPHNDKKTIKRRLVDLRSNPSFDYPEAVSFSTVFDVDVGAENSTDVARKLIRNEKKLLKSLPLFYAMARGGLSLTDARKTKQFNELPSPVWSDFDQLSGVFLKEPTPKQTSFRPGSLLVARHTFTDPEKGLLTTSDIISNPVTVLTVNKEKKIAVSAGDALYQGTRDTLLESLLVKAKPGWSERLPQFIIPDSSSFSNNSTVNKWPIVAQDIAKKDLEQGYVLALVNSNEPYWWRINPKSGETLGMGSYGGQEETDYVVLTTIATTFSSTAFFYRSVQKCDETFPNNKAMADCCIVGNLMATYATAGIGGAEITAVTSGMAKNIWTAVKGVVASIALDLGSSSEYGPVINSACQ